MPPVFGPVSPSPTRLWSCALASGSACAPSHSAKKLASSPSRNSSMTISAPAAPNRPSPSIASTAAMASSMRRRDDDALAGGEPVGLDDDRRAARGDVAPSPRRRRGSGIGGGRDALAGAEILHEGFRAFERGGRGGRAEAAMPAASSASTRPATSGASGPDHDEIDRGSACRRRSARRCRCAGIGTHSASSAMPALPGAQ